MIHSYGSRLISMSYYLFHANNMSHNFFPEMPKDIPASPLNNTNSSERVAHDDDNLFVVNKSLQ